MGTNDARSFMPFGSSMSLRASTFDEASAGQKFGVKVLKQVKELISALIIYNFVVVIVETDLLAKDKDLPLWVEVSNRSLTIIFVLELALKIYILRWDFPRDHAHIFDFVVIFADTSLTIAGAFAGDMVSVSWLRILRLGRLARAAHMFPELRLMMAGLAQAMRAIFWGFVLLSLTLLVWSVVAVQIIHPLNKKVTEKAAYLNIDTCNRCGRAFESTFQAALTFFTQIVAGDSWGKETVPIIEEYPATAIFFIAVYMTLGLAILNLILGVVVNVATEERERLAKEMRGEEHKKRIAANAELYEMCREMDKDGNEELSFEEIRNGYDSNEDFRYLLESLDIEADDLNVVWAILDEDKSGTVTAKEFCDQVFKLKHSEAQFMLAYVKYYFTEFQQKTEGGRARMKAELSSGHQKLFEKLRVCHEQLKADLGNRIFKVKQDVRKLLGEPVDEPVDSCVETIGANDCLFLRMEEPAFKSEAASNAETIWQPSRLEVDECTRSGRTAPILESKPTQADVDNIVLVRGVNDASFLFAEEEEMVAQLRDAWAECHLTINRICRQHARKPNLGGSPSVLANILRGDATNCLAQI